MRLNRLTACALFLPAVLSVCACKPDATASTAPADNGWAAATGSDPMTNTTSSVAQRTVEVDNRTFKMVAYCGKGRLGISIEAHDSSNQPVAFLFDNDNDGSGINDIHFRINVDGEAGDSLTQHNSSEAQNAVSIQEYDFDSEGALSSASGSSTRLAKSKSALIELPMADGGKSVIEISPADPVFQKLASTCPSSS